MSWDEGEPVAVVQDAIRPGMDPVDEDQGFRGSDVEDVHGFARRGSLGHVQPVVFGRVRGQRCEAAYFYQHGALLEAPY